MTSPRLWLLVGGNGAGKSTFYRTSPLSGLPFVNADNIAHQLNPDAPDLVIAKAAQEAEAMRQRYLELRESFCAETVFSHPSKLDFLRRAKRDGFETHLIYIHLATADLHAARVMQRVTQGGHDVPTAKIAPRVLRLRENVKQAAAICNSASFYDNSGERFRLILTVRNGRVLANQNPLPSWATDLTDGLP